MQHTSEELRLALSKIVHKAVAGLETKCAVVSYLTRTDKSVCCVVSRSHASPFSKLPPNNRQI